MRNYIITLLLIGCPLFLIGQVLNNPQQLYDEPGGLYDKDSIRSFYIEFEDPDYHNVLVNSFFDDPSYRIPATISLNGITQDSAGVRYKGNSTFCLPNDQDNSKVPFNIDMNHWIGGQTLMDYKKIKLANAWFDPTFAKEYTGAEIYQNYLPTPEVNLLKLYVQGDYLGLYVNTESINKQFLEKHFDEKNGALFKCDGAAVFCGNEALDLPSLNWEGTDSTDYFSRYALKSDTGWGELLELISTLNFDPDNLDDILNIDRVLWAFAVNTVILNLDTYNGYNIRNYYLYRTEDGLFQMIPWDLDNSFVGALLGFSYWDHQAIYGFDPYFGQDPIPGEGVRPLTQVLFNNPLYRKQYTAHIRTVMKEWLDAELIQSKVEELQTLAFDAAQSDQNKFFPMSFFDSNVEMSFYYGWGFGGILSSVEARKQYLLDHPEIGQIPPALNNVSVTNNIINVSVENATIVELMATTSEYNSKFQPFSMYDDGTNGDALAEDGIYSAMMPFNGTEDVKFYIRAQNDEAMILSPERAEYEFYIYSMTTGTIEIPASEKEIYIYPNPASSNIYIEGALMQITYEIVSANGKIMLKGMINSSNQQVDISSLEQGVYFIKIGDRSYRILKTK